jgi:hypothetical protein
VVICVRCGYDWRTGKKLREAHQNDGDDDLDPAADRAQGEAEQLGSLSWLALSPAGVVVGPYLVWRSRDLETRLRRLGRHEATAAVRQVRQTASAGAVLWLVAMVLLGVLISMRTNRSAAALSQQCRQRMETAGRALRAELQAHAEFPAADEELPQALRRLLEGAGQGEALVCPVHDNLHPYRVASHELLTREADPRTLILWDLEPHADELGQLAHRALRLDGTVETFASRSALSAASQRPLYPELDATTGPPPYPRSTPSPAVGTPGADAVEPLSDLDRHVTRLLAFAYECDDADPDLRGELRITRDAFMQRLGLTPAQLLPLALEADDPKVRLPSARLTARLVLPADRISELLEPLSDDPLPGVRLVVGLIRHERGDSAWLNTLCEVAEAGDPGLRERALEVLGDAAEDPAETKRILEQARTIRGRTGATGDEAIFPLPSHALPHAVALLANPNLQREAQAVLYSAAEAAVPPLVAALPQASPALQAVLLETLDLLRRANALNLSEFLAAVDTAQHHPATLAGVKTLLSGEGVLPAPVQAWTLTRLRERNHGGPLTAALVNALPRIPGDQLVDDLLLHGDHDAVVRLLSRGFDTAHDALDERLADVWGDLSDASLRGRLVGVLGNRLHEASLRALLNAMEDDDESVREAAARAVVTSSALRPPRLRRMIADSLAGRLEREKSTTVRAYLFYFAKTRIIDCSTRDDEHRCSKKLLKALRTHARKGEARAIGALGAHANDKAAGVLLRLLDGARDQTVRGLLTASLRSVTGSPVLVEDADYWKDQFSSQREAFETHQRTLWESAWGHFSRAQERTRKQLEQLQGGDE